VADVAVPVVTTVRSLDDIGPEFNFTVKVRFDDERHNLNSSLYLSRVGYEDIYQLKQIAFEGFNK